MLSWAAALDRNSSVKCHCADVATSEACMQELHNPDSIVYLSDDRSAHPGLGTGSIALVMFAVTILSVGLVS
jgi:hypothetical protein